MNVPDGSLEIVSPLPGPSGTPPRPLREGRTKYGTEPGLLAMREAVANKYTRQFGVPHDPENVMITIG